MPAPTVPEMKDGRRCVYCEMGAPDLCRCSDRVPAPTEKGDGVARIPPMTAAESDPVMAINYALDSLDAYGDPGDAMTFLRMWREGDLSESQQFRDYVAAGGFSA